MQNEVDKFDNEGQQKNRLQQTLGIDSMRREVYRSIGSQIGLIANEQHINNTCLHTWS